MSLERARRRRRHRLAPPRHRWNAGRGPRGDTTGQHSIFEMVPEQHFAITSLTNCGPNGSEFNEEIRRWAFDAYLGIEVKDPQPLWLENETLAEYAGRYETISTICNVTVVSGGLLLDFKTRPEVHAQLGGEEQDEPPSPLGMLPGDGDRYVVTEGPWKGERGYFLRNSAGVINGDRGASCQGRPSARARPDPRTRGRSRRRGPSRSVTRSPRMDPRSTPPERRSKP